MHRGNLLILFMHCFDRIIMYLLPHSAANNCTFDNGGLCAWRNSVQPGDDDFDWTIGSGSTSSSGTGPSTDHYGSRTGRLSTLTIVRRSVIVLVVYNGCDPCVCQ